MCKAAMHRVIKNDCRSFNNLSYKIHLREDYIVAPMDQEILKVFFMMCGVQLLCISPLGAQFTKMVANGFEKAFCVLTFHECRSVTIVERQFRNKFGK